MLAMPSRRRARYIAILSVYLAQNRLQELRIVPTVMQVHFKLFLRRVLVLPVQQEKFQLLPEHLLALNVRREAFPPKARCQRVRRAQEKNILLRRGRPFVVCAMRDLLV